MLQRLIVSCPFGNYVNVPGVSSTLGTFTRFARRTGRDSQYNERLWWLGLGWRLLRTLRYSSTHQGWINQIGLRNPGIDHLSPAHGTYDKIVSIHGFNVVDWEYLLRRCVYLRPAAVELNLSCPNVEPATLELAKQVVRLAACWFRGDNYTSATELIVKLPPVNTRAWALELLSVSPNLILHCCNTLPVPGRGGLSGQYELVRMIVENVRRSVPDCVKIIAGGGVRSVAEVLGYREVGADHVAVGSLLFNPLKIPTLYRMRDQVAFLQQWGPSRCPPK